MIDWDFDQERPMSDFGDMYIGYYFDRDGVRTVGLAIVKEEYRNRGLFTELLSKKLKEGVREVKLISPTDITMSVAKLWGYKYDEELHMMVWVRQRLGLMTDVDEVFR